MKKDTYRKTSSEAFFKEYYGWKAAKEIHREKSLRLRKDAHKEFYVEHKGWFKTLDTIGIVLIALNFIALIITGLVVVKATPDKSFVEANPTQCEWNGWSCHENGFKDIMIPLFRQILIWTTLILLYLYTRNHVFTTTGLMILTAVMIFYCVAIGMDTFHDVGLYLGKIIWGV